MLTLTCVDEISCLVLQTYRVSRQRRSLHKESTLRTESDGVWEVLSGWKVENRTSSVTCICRMPCGGMSVIVSAKRERKRGGPVQLEPAVLEHLCLRGFVSLMLVLARDCWHRSQDRGWRRGTKVVCLRLGSLYFPNSQFRLNE